MKRLSALAWFVVVGAVLPGCPDTNDATGDAGQDAGADVDVQRDDVPDAAMDEEAACPPTPTYDTSACDTGMPAATFEEVYGIVQAHGCQTGGANHCHATALNTDGTGGGAVVGWSLGTTSESAYQGLVASDDGGTSRFVHACASNLVQRGDAPHSALLRVLSTGCVNCEGLSTPPMPELSAPLTPAERCRIASWIQAGALNN